MEAAPPSLQWYCSLRLPCGAQDLDRVFPIWPTHQQMYSPASPTVHSTVSTERSVRLLLTAGAAVAIA